MKIVISLILSFYTLLGAQYTIDFFGNKTFTKKRLYKELGFEQTLWQKILHKKFRPKVEEKLIPTLYDELKLFYQEQGFWDANITAKIQKDTLLFIIEEHTPLHISALATTSDFSIESFIPFKKGDRFIVSQFVKMKKDIKDALLKNGYCSYEFIPKAYVYKKEKSVVISIYLAKGSLCKIKTISIHGLQSIPAKVVKDHIYVQPGDIFSLSKIDESYKRLYSLEYFNAVRFDYSKKIDNQIFLDINCKERKKVHLYKAGVGFESDRGAIVSFQYKNLNYHAKQISLDLFYADITKKVELGYFMPSSITLFQNRYDIKHTFSYTQDRFDIFKSKEITYKLKLLKEDYNKGISFGLQPSHIQIADTNESCIERKNYTLLAPFIDIFIDKRNEKFFPTNGYFLGLFAQGSLLDGEYFKTSVKAGIYYALPKGVLFLKGTLGEILGNKIPPTKLFIAGGVQSNRAYPFRSLYALDSSCKIGGKSLLATTVEYHYPLDSYYLALFWDRTYIDSNTLQFNKAVDGVGIGILYPTVVGTIKVYFGFNPSHIVQNSLGLYIGASF
ncbi:autotransporter assembly complex protein TamA [Nitratiruptor tergarcus]|uniref:Translocation and assembly module TamA n=1 Tax=Nitratiruptor tergarcus DSM 16512 TaxID=1069081 RepID=A0A1W1WRP9_9BACT|nr:BamA/TamA family outer membrane protein [Nitratiruptor tergarcus]SMC08882.1 translocation and assembly module TamA [Nitratiruptor tergarcus DSM 16512]